MSRIDLKAIDSTFIRGLTAFASGSSSSKVGSSGSSAAAQVSLGLRVGAQTYAQSLQSFNSLISSVNVSKASLEKLGDLTDEMIGIAEKATKSFVSDATRRGLDVQLKKVANKFRKVVDEAQIGDRDLLSKDGLKEVFALVGLDPEKADTISAIFDEIQNPKRDAVLASEENRGSRPVSVPKASYPGASASSSWNIQNVSNAGSGVVVSSGLVSQNGSFFVGDENYNNQNPSNVRTLAIKSSGGNLNTLPSGLSQEVTLLSVSETSGYALISSKEDFLGQNLGGQQIFIVDPSGNVIQQVTNFSAGEVVSAGDISADGTEVVLGYDDGLASSVARFSIPTLGSTPAASVGSTVLDTFGSGEALVARIDEAGDNIAILHNQRPRVYDSSNTLDAGSADYSRFDDIGFVDNGLIVAVDAGNLYNTSPGAGSFGLFGGLSLSGGGLDATYAFSEAGPGGFVAFRDSSGEIGYFDVGNFSQESVYVGATGISSISIADNGNDGITFGFYGQLNDNNFSDTSPQLYRMSFSTVTQANQNVSITTAEPEKILNGTIARRPEAYRMLTDLKALKKQITSNIKALGDALDVIGQNVSLVRATGLAMLDIRNQLTGAEEADEVAKLLRDRIAQNAGVALLAQAENLTPIAYAELNRGLK